MPLIAKPLPSLTFLVEAFRLDVETGQLFWRDRPCSHFSSVRRQKAFNTKLSGKRADRPKKDGYRFVKFQFGGKKEVFAAHRVIWKLIHGSDPTQVIDHIDRNPGNNRPDNLRDVSLSENLHNCINRTPGRTFHRGGVSLERGKFRVRIHKDGRYFHLGCFPTMAAAEAAIKAVL